MAEKPSRRGDVYQMVTDTIIAMLENGAGEFELPWYSTGADLRFPENIASRARYRGVNTVTLWTVGIRRGFAANLWGTYRQWLRAGARVRKGEKGAPIVFYKKLEPNGEDDEASHKGKPKLIARASWVFNAEQVDGYDMPKSQTASQIAPIQSVEGLVHRTGAIVRYGGDMAYYTPVDDRIQMPMPEQFTGTATSTATEAYYATLLHELVHWSGAEPRLNRDLVSRFGIDAYAAEELVAELGAAFLCCELRVTPSPRRDHASYIDHWLRVMRGDRRAIVTAASRANQAAEYLLALDVTERRRA